MTRIAIALLVFLSAASTAKLALGAEDTYYDHYLKREVRNPIKPIVPDPISDRISSKSSQYVPLPKAERQRIICRYVTWSRRLICQK